MIVVILNGEQCFMSCQNACWVLPTTAYSQASLGLLAWSSSAQTILQFRAKGRKQTANFLAKYVNGNRMKGIYNAHLNIRSLINKVGEIKNIINQHRPNIFGLSECELRKVNNTFDEINLKYLAIKFCSRNLGHPRVLPGLLFM